MIFLDSKKTWYNLVDPQTGQTLREKAIPAEEKWSVNSQLDDVLPDYIEDTKIR